MSAPRNVILIDEFENAMKGKYGAVSFGVLNGDITLSNWQGSIITEKGDIFEFSFKCDDDFPNSAPNITFEKKLLVNKYLARICNSEGKINEDIIKKINWTKYTLIGDYLLALKKFLDN